MRSLADPTRNLVSPTRAYIAQLDPEHEQGENILCWAILRWLHVGHVVFMLFVSCLLANVNAIVDGIIWALECPRLQEIWVNFF